MKTKIFGKTHVSHPLPYLLSIQKESWDNFLKNGLHNLFREVSPIRDYTGKEMELWFTGYKLSEPKYSNDLEAKKNNDSYEATLRVKVKLINLQTQEATEQELFFCDLPLLTSRGTFIVNGVERVAVSQLVRSPGAFFTAHIHQGKKLFGAKLIPNRGAWLEFETENTGQMVVKIDRRRKVPVTSFLRALHPQALSDKDLEEMFNGADEIKETLMRDTAHTQEDALLEVYSRIRPGDVATPAAALEMICNLFFSFQRYDLSEVGRWRMQQRFDAPAKDITVEDRVLTIEDIINVVKEIIRLNNDPTAEPDQIDHLGNRRVRTFSETLEGRLRVGLMRMERIMKDRMSTLESGKLSPSLIVNSRPFMAAVKEFFLSSQISQFMDNENPLSEVEHKRRLTATGPGGLTRERAGFDARDVQPSHYGRICPIQTPEGGSVGLVSHLSRFARLNRYGFLETPYFKVNKGKVTDELVYFNAYEEEKYTIANGGVELNDKKEIVEDRVEARVKGEPVVVPTEKIEYIDVSPEQFISISTSCIPFLQNDDANRTLMGSNVQRQSVPLIIPEAPLVSTGTETKVATDSGQVVVAEDDGEIKEVDGKRIVLKTKKGEKEYVLNLFNRTNQYTCLHQRPIVEKGQKVKKGEVLSDGGSISKGRLALGKNLLVAFMSWRGHSYEDAIVLSERLVKDDVYTSIQIQSFTCDVRETKLGPETTTSDISNVSEKKLKDLDEEGIVRIGAEVGPGDILVGKISPKGEADMTAEERLLKAIFGEKAKDVKDSSLTMDHGKRGRVIGVKVFSRENGHKMEPGVLKKVEVEVAEMRKIQTGDKLAGRHGNKGIVARILPVEDMPFLADGTPIDIIMNPLSVASRMNIGQILETHLGWAAKKLDYIAITPSMSGANEDDIKDELEKAGLPRSGQVELYDGITGQPFSRKITVGMLYMMKLIHMVKDKMHTRSIGPYSLITQQPLGGKAQFGGQRFGEMEVWALEGYGAAYTLQEMLTIKSDDVQGRASAYEAILKQEEIKNPNVPASFSLLVNELKSLGLNIEVKENPQD